MRRIRNSVKAIIVSLCLVVVLAGSILGVVLVNRNKGKGNPSGPNNSNGGPIVKYELTEDQKKMVASINKSAVTSVEIAPQYDYSKYVLSNDQLLDDELILKDFGRYISYNSTVGKVIYVKKHSQNYYVNILDEIASGFDVLSSNISLESTVCVVVDYVYFDAFKGKYVKVYKVIDFTSAEYNIIATYEFEKDSLEATKSVSDEFLILNYDNYFVVAENNSVGNLTIVSAKIYNLKGDVICEIENLNGFDSRQFNKSSFYFVFENKLYYSTVENSYLKTNIVNLETDVLYNITLTDRYLFIEKSELVEVGTIGAVGNVLYSYSLIDLFTNKSRNLTLNSGYVKAEFSSVGTDGYYYLFEKKLNSDSSTLQTKGMMVYYDSADGKVVSYEADSIKDKIIYSANNMILTSGGVYSCLNSVEAVVIREFVGDEEIRNEKINNNSFMLYTDGGYYIYNINGNKIFETEFINLYSYSEGYYFGFDGLDYYHINVTSDQMTKIENFVKDDDFDNHDLIFNGGGYYLETNTEGELKSLYDYSGKLKFNNVKDIDMIQKSKTHIKIVFDDDSVKTFELSLKINKTQSGGNTGREEVVEPVNTYSVDNYYDHEGVGDNGDCDVDAEDHYSDSGANQAWAHIYVWEDGYYPSGGYIAWCGDAFIGSWFGDSTFNFSFDYTSGTTTGSNLSYCDNVYTESYDANYSDHGRSIYYYLCVAGSSDNDGLGDHINSVSINLSVLKHKVHAYAMPSTKDYVDITSKDNYTESKSSEPTGTTNKFDVPIDIGTSSTIVGGYIYAYSYFYEAAQDTPSSLSTYYYESSNKVVDGGTSTLYRKDLYTTYYTYAIYTEHKYKIKEFNANGGYLIEGGKYPTNEDIKYTQEIEVTAPEREGFTFNGWNVKISGESSNIHTKIKKYNTSTNGTFSKLTHLNGVELVFTAQWKGNLYTVEFVFGSVTDSKHASILLKNEFSDATTRGLKNVDTYNFLKAEYNPSFASSATSVTGSNNSGELSIKQYNYSYQNLEVVDYKYGFPIYGYVTRYATSNIFQFSYDDYTYLSSGMYSWTELNVPSNADPSIDATKIAPSIDPNNANFGFNVLNSQYYIVDWAFTLKNETPQNNDYVLLGNTQYDLLTYLTEHGITKTNNNNGVIKLYAVYQPKKYNVHRDEDLDNGFGSTLDKISTENVTDTLNHKYADISVNINLIDKDGASAELPATTTNVHCSDNPKIEVILNNLDAENGAYYIIDKIEILKFGYKVDASTYKYSKIVFINPSSKSNTENKSNYLDIASIYLNNESTFSTILKNNTNKDGDNFYYVAANQEGINGFKVNEYSNTKFEIEFKNLGYTGDSADSISNSSVNGKGAYGFTIKVYYQSLYTANDSFDKSADATSKITTNYGEFVHTNVTPLYKQQDVTKINANGSKTTGVDLYYFWLNGKKIVLCESDSPKTSNLQNYYTVSSTNLNGSIKYEQSASTLFVANKANLIDISSYSAAQLEEFKNDFTSNKDVVYVEIITQKDNTFGYVYYKGGATSNSELSSKNYTNYNNTQFVVITPKQEKHNVSLNPTDAQTLTSRYELMTYLSAVEGISNVTKYLTLERVVKDKDKTDVASYKYETYTMGSGAIYHKYLMQAYDASIDDSNKYTNSLTATEYMIKYLGDSYWIQYVFIFEVGNREFFLYFGVRADNHVRYFLTSNVGSTNAGVSTTSTIKFVFNEIKKPVTVSVSDEEEHSDTADVTFFEDNINSTVNFTNNSNAYNYVTSAVSGANKTYTSQIRPNDLYMIGIKPHDGYIVKSLEVKMADGTVTLINFELSNIFLNVLNDFNSNRYHSYTQTIGENSIYLIQYKASSNKSFIAHEVSGSGLYGIYYSETPATSWDASRISHVEYAGFETIYLMIAGVYDDVSVSVQTTSFVEFSFLDTNNVLERNETSQVKYFKRANTADNGFEGYISVYNGTKLLNVLNIGPQTKFYDSSSVTTESATGKYVKYDTKGYVLYKQIVDGDVVKYEESQDGEYIIIDDADVSSYTKYSSSVYGGSASRFFLKDITNLSIIALDSGNNKIKLGVNFGEYDASLVSVLDDYVRVVFIGKSYLFEKGIQIFASGEDYSAYFTSGKFYYDWGTNAGTLNGNDSVAFDHLTDAEGKDSAYNSLDKEIFTVDDNTANEYEKMVGLESDDLLIYMQIDDIKRFFETSMSWSKYRTDLAQLVEAQAIQEFKDKYPDDIGFENARKYYFSVVVGANKTTMNVNSFIYNDNLNNTRDENNNPINTKGDYGTSYKVDPTKENTKNNIANILKDEVSVLQSDNRNNLTTGWARTVTNAVKGSNTVYPYMWLAGSFYQLDYVVTPKGGVSSDKYTAYEKSQSWFNNTVLTNIDYGYIDGSGIQQNTNWQEHYKLNYDNNVSASDPNYEISGYRIDYTYNAIPGYYLEYVVIETVDYGIFYIPTNQIQTTGGKTSSEGDILCYKYDNGNNHKTRMYYHISFDAVNNSYTFRLYDNSNDENGVAGLNSLAVLSNNITVSFFSKAHQININYNLNIDSDKISAKDTAKVVDNSQHESYVQSGIYYDTLVTLNAIATMKGYTFVGWGSQDYNADGDLRHDIVANTWNSSSSWIAVTGSTNNMYGTAESQINYFKYSNRSLLLNFENFGNDFYVKSSNADRSLKTGYFITDTGNAYASGGLRNENYNFWSVYAEDFIDKIGSRTSQTFTFDMYAVWKANVYAVEIEMNDKDNANGSSNAYIAFQGQRFGYNAFYIWNNNTTDNNYKYTFTQGELVGGLANKIDSSVLKQSNLADDTLSNTYYCYVQFDTDNWYLTSGKNTKESLNDELYSYYESSATPFIYSVGSESNKLNYVIDRYGYSWLGWFSDELANTYESNFNAKADKLVFGSDYYYTKTSTALVNRQMPYLRADGWTKSGEVNVHISDFETIVKDGDNVTYQDNFSTEVYSEFVYKNSYAFLDAGKSYVYHYDYKSKTEVANPNPITGAGRVAYVNGDYLNTHLKSNSEYGKLQKVGSEVIESALVYYDTSLTLDCFVKLESGDLHSNGTEDAKYVQLDRNVAVDSTPANYRYITLYSYWLNNKYNVIIDYRDQGSTSIDNIGSSVVTNKTDIESAFYTDSNDLSGAANKAINSTYFDDNYFDYVMNMSIPTRVGYDFIGWSFFYRDPDVYMSGEAIQLAGDLYKYNGLTYVSDLSYTLTVSSTLKKYYYIDRNAEDCTCVNNPSCEICGGDGKKDVVKSKDINVLYNHASLNNIGSSTYSNSFNSQYEVLNHDLEVYGDAEGDGNHNIYIFALWRAQTFTINVGLNVDTEDLTNSYDLDSSYSIGFYKDYEDNKPTGYTGINSLFLKQKEVLLDAETNIDMYSDVYTEVVSNVSFVITFDELFSESAIFTDFNDGNRVYKLKDLFAISTGYYFIGWLYDSNDLSSHLIANTLKSVYGYSSEIIHKDETGGNSIQSVYFDNEWYSKLYVSNYKNVTGVDATATGSVFEENNRSKLNVVDASGASTNFGYVKIKDTAAAASSNNYYIETEHVLSVDNYRTESHNLMFRYNGRKYYVQFYDNNGAIVLIQNDFSHLYYQPNAQNPLKYIIQFDYEGNAYYIDNTSSYSNMVYLSNLGVAVFDNKEHLNDSTKIGAVDYDYLAKTGTFVVDGFNFGTTRQFTLYADWDIKEDFKALFTNGNNGLYNESNIIKSDISNPGLAGYYSVYNNSISAVEPAVATQTTYHAGANNTLGGEDKDTLTYTYTFYNDLGFDLLPYFNGRFLNKMYFDFDRIEYNTSEKVTTMYQTVKYRLVFEFKWSNADRIITISSISLKRYNPAATGDDKFSQNVVTCQLNTAVDVDGNAFVTIKNNSDATKLYKYLSVIDSVSLNNSGGAGFFNISAYSSPQTRNSPNNPLDDNANEYYGRRDVNMVSFNLNDLLSSIHITCEYSVQTYSLIVHHLFDESGDKLAQVGSTDIYNSQFTQLTPGEQYDTESSLDSSGVYTDVTPTGTNQALATIRTDLKGGSYNVPYGYFIYGVKYDSGLVGYRPMDDYYTKTSGDGYNGTTAHDFDGFNYLYQAGNYSKGRGGSSELVLDGDGSDLYFDQGSPILGSSVVFPTKSIRFNKSFYLFKGWYEDTGRKNGGFVTFDAYGEIDEATYISRNITLYGYYYSSNTPMNIQFYKWNNDWNENSPAYLPYLNNADDYTLSSIEENSPYVVSGGFLLPNTNAATTFVDEFGRITLKLKKEYGVDSSQFSQDVFTGYEIGKTEPALLSNVLKTYWYYDESYSVIYKKFDGDAENTYFKFDPEIQSKYQFVPLPNGDSVGLIVDAVKYDEFVNDGVTIYEILAEVKFEGGKYYAYLYDSSNNIITASKQEMMFSDEYREYYFYNTNTNRYHFFAIDLKNTVMTKLIPEKDVFYYERGGIVKVKIMTGNDMVTLTYKVWNETDQDYVLPEGIPNTLSTEKVFVYGERFTGADLYAAFNKDDTNNAKYYKYHEISDEMLNELSATSEFIRENEPRYYVDINGERYYTMIRINKQKGNHNTTYNFKSLYTSNGTKFNTSFEITTLNNYYVLMDDVYHKINYKELRDSGNSVYINPFANENTVQLDYSGEVKTYYFDYNGHSKTTGLWETYNPAGTVKFSDEVRASYNIYTPINSNYSLNAILKNTSQYGPKWEPSDITLNQFPSLNFDYWIDNPEYVLLGYINVTDDDIKTMRSSEGASGDIETDWQYIPALSQIVGKNYVAGAEPDTYDILADVNISEQKITIADSGNTISLYYNADEDHYYFYHEYEDKDGKIKTSYYYFSDDGINVVKIKPQQGGQIYTAYDKYIDDLITDDAGYGDLSLLRIALKDAVAGKIKEFSLNDLLKSPLAVEGYQLSTIDHKTIERIDMKIRSQFVFDHDDIQSSALNEYIDILLDLELVEEVDDGVYRITISTSFNYTFNLISTKTQINTNIYAIPVYAPDIIKFETDAINVSGKNVSIDYNEMKITHFDLKTYRLYSGSYVWELPELLPGATEEEKKERENLLYTADYMQFIVLDSDQFAALDATKVGRDVKLHSMITGDDLNPFNDKQLISQASLSKDNSVLTFDFSDASKWIPGKDYYIASFYYGIDTANKEIEFVFSAGSNLIYTADELRAEHIASSKLTSSTANAMTDQQIVEFTETLENYGEVKEIRYNKHINRISDNIVKVSIAANGTITTSIVNLSKAQS